MGAPWRDETPEEHEKEQQLVDDIYTRFVARVARGRNLTDERVRELATGEVWLGERALELGLVDEIGDLERAVEVAASLAGVEAKSAPVRIRRPFTERLIGRFAVTLSAEIADTVEARLANRYRF